MVSFFSCTDALRERERKSEREGEREINRETEVRRHLRVVSTSESAVSRVVVMEGRLCGNQHSTPLARR